MKRVGILESNLSGSGFFGFKVCKDAGYHITFFTRNLPRYRDIQMGREYIDAYVDEIIETETNDFGNIRERVLQIHEVNPFDAFLTLSEYDIVPTAKIAAEIGVRHVDPNAALQARNKHLTRLACQAQNVPAPAFVAIQKRDEVLAAIKLVGLPCIVKPADETSSTDVRKCYSLEEAMNHYEDIRSKSQNVRGQNRYEYVLLEQCINGYEVSVETLTLNGKHYVYGVTDKMLGGEISISSRLGTHSHHHCLAKSLRNVRQLPLPAWMRLDSIWGLRMSRLKSTIKGQNLLRSTDGLEETGFLIL